MEANYSPFTAPGMVEVEIEEPAETQNVLAEAIEAVMGAAIHHETGILITEIGPGRYIVRAHPEVPSGLIRQKLS